MPQMPPDLRTSWRYIYLPFCTAASTDTDHCGEQKSRTFRPRKVDKKNRKQPKPRFWYETPSKGIIILAFVVIDFSCLLFHTTIESSFDRGLKVRRFARHNEKMAYPIRPGDFSETLFTKWLFSASFGEKKIYAMDGRTNISDHVFEALFNVL